MRTINTDLIEKILLVSNKLIKFANSNIFNGTELTPSQFNILGEVILNKGLSVNDLKEKLIVSAPALSQILNRMEKNLLIKRNLGKTNKREIKISPTKKGIKLYNELNKKYIFFAETRLKDIEENDKKNMIKLLENLEKIIS